MSTRSRVILNETKVVLTILRSTFFFILIGIQYAGLRIEDNKRLYRRALQFSVEGRNFVMKKKGRKTRKLCYRLIHRVVSGLLNEISHYFRA